MSRLRLDKRGISNVIVVMLSLVLVVVIVANVVMSSYQMNQFDLERMQEKLTLVSVERQTDGVVLSIQNEGPLTSHVIALWIVNSTIHERYDVNIFLNSGEKNDYTITDISLPSGNFTAKIVTERGNIAVFSS